MRALLIAAFLFISGGLSAQLEFSPIYKPKKADKVRVSARTQSETPLSLPFWDDFSFSDNQPLDSLWQNSENVRISVDFGLAAPSIKVAAFDGLTADGSVYNVNPQAQGETDVLTSCPIDLSTLGVDDNVYLSFHYQRGGNGPAPENSQGDSLTLEFLSVAEDTTWVQVWPENSSALEMGGDFVQDIVRVAVDSFFHERFQFRFRSFGRQSGIWDTWNVDYVYLNDDRSPGDLSFPDRTITSKLSSPFGQYTSIPANLFSFDQVTEPRVSRFNLELDAVNPQSVQYVLEVKLDSYKDSIATAFNNTIQNELPRTSQQGVTDTIDTEQVLLPEFFTFDADSILIDYIFKYQSNDPASPPGFEPIDFKINDTIQTRYVLKDYYAYDDGTAEFGAGFKSSGNRLAVQYSLPDGVTDTLTAIDLYFPYIGLDPAGKPIDLIIWRDNNGEPGTVAYQERTVAVRSPVIDEYVRYDLRVPVELTGIFYVGYRQNFEGDFRIGLDRNTISVDKIFANTSGFWEVEDDFDIGSLMIRPVFGDFDLSSITSLEEENNLELMVYPNPSPGTYFINTAQFQGLAVLDLRGAPIYHRIVRHDTTSEIDISDAPPGIYIIKVELDGKVQFLKVLKE